MYLHIIICAYTCVHMHIKKFLSVFVCAQVLEYTEIGEITDLLFSKSDIEISYFTMERYVYMHQIMHVL